MAAGPLESFLWQSAVYLAGAAVAVPLFNRLKLGSIVGFIAAGVAVGPHALGLTSADKTVFDVASLGIVLFLFVIGLEMSLSRLWSLRRDIFGLGAAQMAVTGAVVGGALYAAGFAALPAAMIAGAALATSATVLALQYLKERGEMHSEYGSHVFPVLLAQDLLVIPVLIAIPLAAGAGAGGSPWVGALKAVAVIGALVVAVRYGLDPLLRAVARSGSREAFLATALLIVVAVALLVSSAGLSMALGAFLAGVFLSESAYRHQIMTDIEPFRGLLLGLFFISIGMQLDLPAIASAAWLVAGGVAALVVVKTLLTFGLARMFGLKSADALKSGALLSQGGEFAFVVASLSAAVGLLTAAKATILSAVVVGSMALTPLVMMLVRRLVDRPATASGLRTPHNEREQVLVVGFGRMGQIVAQVLNGAGVEIVALDRNPDHIAAAERMGFQVFYGDGSRLDTLVAAGALEAHAVVLTMDDAACVNGAVACLRERAPHLPILAVAHDRLHEIALRPLQPSVVVRETLESSLFIAKETLRTLKFSDGVIDEFVAQFRKLDRQRLLRQIDKGVDEGVDLMHRRYERSPTAQDAGASVDL